MQRKQARWHGVRGVWRITPLIHAHQREAMLYTRIHVLRHIMQVCWDEDDLPRIRLRESCLTPLQLSERMQFADKAFSAAPLHTRGLLKKHVQVGDVFEDEYTGHEIYRRKCRNTYATRQSLETNLYSQVARYDNGALGGPTWVPCHAPSILQPPR